ncbi:MAG: radical SAM protein [Butyrivibrio sp.]|nr:radical SAM protein [Acetatifactor muris]MCM1560380.1 radical SAM protein [Butyrivibrio sp.]
MSDCTLCPRQCHANRAAGQTGFCRQTAELTVARAALHFWEEPCISGSCGSGAVFFFGCGLRCVFCQNHTIAAGRAERSVTPERLAEIFSELQENHAANINLVTAGHFIPQICRALRLSKERGLSIPVVYNTGSYEEPSSLRLLEGLVDIWLPDLKYYSAELAGACSHAPDYFPKAAAAIGEMFRLAGTPKFDPGTGLMKSGVIVRHLVLPGQVKDSKKILRYLHDTYGNDIYVSILNQYTPMAQTAHIPGLNRRVTDDEYRRVLDFAEKIGIENGFIQEGGTAEESFIPPFSTGVT